MKAFQLNESGNQASDSEGLTQHEKPIVRSYVNTVDASVGKLFELFSRMPRPVVTLPEQPTSPPAESIGSQAVATVANIDTASPQPGPQPQSGDFLSSATNEAADDELAKYRQEVLRAFEEGANDVQETA